MIQITPVGLLAENAGASIEFYRTVLALERVIRMQDYDNMTLLRVESPRIEIEQTCIEIYDRPNRPYSNSRQKLRLICDVEPTVAALNQAGIATDADNLEFTDINGISWQLSDHKKRYIETC
ncbi:MAG: hypothetical protein KKB51_18775 [Candidatus Riflebacteria bacterium]|nr:hypothetical protein [Candidatus Riflebacteria bacterium]